MPIYVGIDLGTTFTGVAYSNHRGHCEIIKDAQAPYNLSKFPSELFFDQSSKIWYVGWDAQNEAEGSKTQETLKEFKLDMGVSTKYQVPGIGYITPIDASTEILAYALKLVREMGLHPNFNDIYWAISVPALFDEQAKDATKQAAIKAGIPPDKLSLVLEPEAATLAAIEYDHIKIQEGEYILTFDFGGGTLDIVLLRLAKGGILEPVVNNGGYLDLGGKDIDKALFKFCYEKLRRTKPEAQNWPPLDRLPKAHVDWELRDKISQKLKRFLGRGSNSRTISLAPSPTDMPARVHISKDEFRNEVLSVFITRAKAAVEKVLRRGNKKPIDISRVVMVGGTSHIIYFKEMLASIFGEDKIVRPADPVEAVMRGTVLYARNPEMIRGKIAGRTYGLRSHREAVPGDPPDRITETEDGNYYRVNHIFFRAGEVISPEGKSDTFTPLVDGQPAVKFKLLWGDNENPDECEEAGSVTIPIPNPPKDYPLELSLVVEKDNMMHIYAVDHKTGNKIQGTIDWIPIAYHEYKP